MNANTEYLVKAIESELDRLEMLASETNSGGWVVTAEDELPDGWVTVYDDYERFYAPACDVLERLAGCEGDEQTDYLPDGTLGPCPWVSGSHALDGLSGSEPGASEWRDHHDFVRGVEVTDGFCLVVLRTNAGLRYGFAPAGADFSAFNTTHDFSDRFESAEDAIGACDEYAAAESAFVTEATKEINEGGAHA